MTFVYFVFIFFQTAYVLYYCNMVWWTLSSFGALTLLVGSFEHPQKPIMCMVGQWTLLNFIFILVSLWSYSSDTVRFSIRVCLMLLLQKWCYVFYWWMPRIGIGKYTYI